MPSTRTPDKASPLPSVLDPAKPDVLTTCRPLQFTTLGKHVATVTSPSVNILFLPRVELTHRKGFAGCPTKKHSAKRYLPSLLLPEGFAVVQLSKPLAKCFWTFPEFLEHFTNILNPVVGGLDDRVGLMVFPVARSTTGSELRAVRAQGLEGLQWERRCDEDITTIHPMGIPIEKTQIRACKHKPKEMTDPAILTCG